MIGETPITHHPIPITHHPPPAVFMFPRPRLRTILLLVNLVVLVVPVLAFAGLQIYDTQLIRRTEAEVISQAAHIKAHTERELAYAIEEAQLDGLPDDFGVQGEVKWPEVFYDLRPIDPVLDSSRSEIRAPEGDPQPPRGGVDPLWEKVGDHMEPILVDAQRVTLAGMSVVDWQGNTVATTSSSHRDMSLYDREEIQRALDGEIVHLLRERDNIPEGISLESISRETSNRVFVAMPITYEGRIVGVVSVWRTPMSLPQALYKSRGIFLTLLALILLGGLTITGLTSFYIGRPILRLIDQTEKVARDESDGTEPIGKPGTYEVQRLSESIAEMAVSLEERADYIRTFARSVSHEFKTPLTSIRGTVELLQDHFDEMSEVEREEFLQILDADAERLQQLVHRLLELAKADVARSGDHRCDALSVVNAVAEAHRRDDFDIVVDTDLESAPVRISREALSAALTNLVVNAGEHGDSQAMIEVYYEESGDDGREGVVVIAIEDDGPGISEANAERIFDEFFTTARDRGGTGLGLSITRALLEAHDGSIRYVPTDAGARFELELIATSNGTTTNSK